MAAPTFSSVTKQCLAASTAGANKAYVKAYDLWVNHGPQAGAILNGNGKNVAEFIRQAQLGAPIHTAQFKRSMNVS